MKKMLSIALLIASTSTHATPLRLDYSVAPLSGGIFDYNFTLTLDNHDSSWLSGQNFNWIIFGDCGSACSSPLTNFVGDSADLPIGPFPGYFTSAGGHNGPTLLDLTPNANDGGWIPTAVGQSLAWSGTSTADLPQGSLRWSNLVGTRTSVYADLEIANRINNVPEPSVALLLAVSAFAMFGYRKAQ